MKTCIFSLFALILLFASCGRTRDCEPGGVNIIFKGYDTSSFDTVIIEKYTPKSGLSDLISSKIYVLQDTFNYSTAFYDDGILLRGFTCDWDWEDNGILTAKYEWKIITANHEYRVSKMTYDVQTYKCGGIFSLDCFCCLSRITQVDVDGQAISPAPDNTIALDK